MGIIQQAKRPPFEECVCARNLKLGLGTVLLAGAAMLQLSIGLWGDHYHHMSDENQHHRLALMLKNTVTEPQATTPVPVECDNVPAIEPVQLANMASPEQLGAPYKVSFSSWDGRLRDPQFGLENTTAPSNPVIREIQSLLPQTQGVFVDVGANVGFMTLFGVALGRTTYSIDPITYNIAKLCEGHRENTRVHGERGSLLLYQAAAGAVYQPKIDVWRPANKHFDQSSLSSKAILNTKSLVNEAVPMIRVDDIVPDSVAVGMVKIDVQGHELDVLLGMEGIMSRDTGYPRYIYYEESPKHIEMAGHQPGGCQKLLERYGYTCTKRIGGNVLCERENRQMQQQR